MDIADEINRIDPEINISRVLTKLRDGLVRRKMLLETQRGKLYKDLDSIIGAGKWNVINNYFGEDVVPPNSIVIGAIRYGFVAPDELKKRGYNAIDLNISEFAVVTRANPSDVEQTLREIRSLDEERQRFLELSK